MEFIDHIFSKLGAGWQCGLQYFDRPEAILLFAVIAAVAALAFINQKR